MHISLIDDEKLLANKISKKLQLSGYIVDAFYSFQEFMQRGFYEDISDLYIIDISLGDGSGYEIIKELRNRKKTNKPIIVISGFGEVDKKLFGFNIGIDDYITKPFSPDELIARIKALLRRSNENLNNKEIRYKGIYFDILSNEVFLNGEVLTFLNKKEKIILTYFLKNLGKLVEKESFIKVIWGHRSTDVTNNTINATLSKLRKKLGDNFPLQTIPHIGYILE
ncbi:MAG: response regulator transcription factor [Candidatus Altimarinota bacterium]